jgi:hypothetical protein
MLSRTQANRRRTAEVPRWRRQPAPARRRQDNWPFWARRTEPEPAPVLQISGRRAQRQAVQAMTAMQAQLAAQQLTGPDAPAQRIMVPHKTLRLRWKGWRFRRHLQPFIWLALLLCGSALRAAPYAAWCGLLAAVLVTGLMWVVVCQRDKARKYHFGPWTRHYVLLQAAVTGLWLPLLAVYPLRDLVPWVLLSWAPFAGLWARRYRWRPREQASPDVAPADDAATWAALAAEQKWNATLGRAEHLDGGGRRYPVQCDGVKTVMKKILALPDNVAGAWHTTTAECYAERDPQGVTSCGYLTILPGSSLQASSWWDGKGMDRKTGLARIGRFADGSPAHVKLYAPRFGCRHDLDSGTTGSGKSELLNLKIFIALVTGWFVPVILDPQEGQSLPFWQDRCIYASGISAVERLVRGLHAAFFDRSAQLSKWRWSDDGVEMPGMPFFDYELLGGALPMPWIFLDEAHEVLKDGNKWQRQITADVVEMARLIRKAGGKMTLATQIPGLADLGGSQALRDMLRGGNVWSGRTANKVASGMIGLVKDPSEIPRYFRDKTETAGLGYTDGPDNRPDAPMRNDRVPRSAYKDPPAVRQLDDRFLEVMDRAMKDAVSPTSSVAPVGVVRAIHEAGRLVDAANASPQGRALLARPLLSAVPEEPDDAPEGRRCVDAVWQVLSTDGGPMERGEIIVAAGALSAEWKRAKPWSIKAVGLALRDLTDGKEAGRVVRQPVKGGPYQAEASEVVT